jgi:predicted nucleic acid-binding protein
VTVGIDSQILIYAGIVPSKHRNVDPKTAEHLKEPRYRARRLLDQILAKETIVLPMVAITEILVPVPEHKKGAVINVLSKRFICPPFEMQAAVIASDLWRRYKELPADEQYGDRDVMRADTMIVATAKAVGATAFYSHDRKCRAMAALVMEARKIPDRDPDGNLFEKQQADDEEKGLLPPLPTPKLKRPKKRKAEHET